MDDEVELTMCQDYDCPMKFKCRRFTDDISQLPHFVFSPRLIGTCDEYEEM